MTGRAAAGALACLLGTCVLLVAGLFLAFNNTTVTVSAADTGVGGGGAREVGCSIAPWDAGVNDNRDRPGGEHSAAYSDEVAAKCYRANSTRYDAAVGSGVLALLLLSVPVATSVRNTRRSRST